MIEMATEGRKPEPGAFQLTWHDWHDWHDWHAALRANAATTDQYLDLLGMPSGGALRVSVGLASNGDDLERFLAFVETAYRDRVVATDGLAPRRGC